MSKKLRISLIVCKAFLAFAIASEMCMFQRRLESNSTPTMLRLNYYVKPQCLQWFKSWVGFYNGISTAQQTKSFN
jgi:hypothetical protein